MIVPRLLRGVARASLPGLNPCCQSRGNVVVPPPGDTKAAQAMVRKLRAMKRRSELAKAEEQEVEEKVVVEQQQQDDQYIKASAIKDDEVQMRTHRMMVRVLEQVKKERHPKAYFEDRPEWLAPLEKEWKRLEAAVMASTTSAAHARRVAEICVQMAEDLTMFDPRPKEGQDRRNVTFLGWGSFVHHYRAADFTVLIRPMLRREAEVSVIAAFVVERTLYWNPELIPGLFAQGGPSIVEDAKGLCWKAYKAPTQSNEMDVYTRGRLLGPALNFYGSVLGIVLGLEDAEIRAQALDSFIGAPVLLWWRTAVQEVDPKEAHQLVEGLVFVFSAVVHHLKENRDAVQAQDMELLEKLARVRAPAKKDEMETHQQLMWRELMARGMAARILRMKGDSRHFVEESRKRGWLTRLAQAIRAPPRWREQHDAMQYGSMMGDMLGGLAIFCDSHNKEISHLGVQKVTADLLRYGLGWVLHNVQDKDKETRKNTIDGLLPFFQGAMEFVMRFCQAEITEKQYSSVAYNDERILPWRHARLPGIVSRLLRMYPADETVVTGTCAMMLLLLEYPEQHFDIRDSALFQSFAVAREKATDPKLQKRIVRVMKLIQERVPMV
eukprot:Hpha_TRINITY_DN1422_c0_g1::TRINITY_DN1422_c0_g1_i1::g.9586::m.9586